MTEQELVERLRAYADDDHERLCGGRNYDCTCGYDERRDPLLAEAADAITRLVEERDKLVAALRMASCPRPANHRPDEFDIGDCCDAGECGCFARRALEQSQ